MPGERPRIISDNGPQFVARDFKEFIRMMGLTHVRTSPYYPQSNGKLERWHESIKRECIRPAAPESLDEALRLVSSYVDTLQPRTAAQCLGIHHPCGQAQRLRAVDLRGTGSQVGRGAPAPAAGAAGDAGGCLMTEGFLQSKWPGRRIGQRRGATRAPPRGQDRSQGRAFTRPCSPSSRSGIGRKAINLRGTMPRLFR